MSTNVRFVENPNFPKQDVALVAMSCGHPEIHKSLRALNIEIIPVTPHTDLELPIACHADIRVVHMFDNQVMVAKDDLNLMDMFFQFGFNVVSTKNKIQSPYPKDSILNAVILKKQIIGNIKHLDENLLEWCELKNIKRINVRQGYAKCSTALINETSLITCDHGIAKMSKEHGLDVLTINPGHIVLEGYPYGFIGGCCGLIGCNKIAFTGSLKKHPDGDRIIKFIRSKNVDIVELTNEPLVDLGGVLPLKEYFV